MTGVTDTLPNAGFWLFPANNIPYNPTYNEPLPCGRSFTHYSLSTFTGAFPAYCSPPRRINGLTSDFLTFIVSPYGFTVAAGTCKFLSYFGAKVLRTWLREPVAALLVECFMQVVSAYRRHNNGFCISAGRGLSRDGDEG